MVKATTNTTKNKDNKSTKQKRTAKEVKGKTKASKVAEDVVEASASSQLKTPRTKKDTTKKALSTTEKAVKTSASSETTLEAKPEVKSEAKPKVKAEEKSKAKPKVKSEVKPEVKSETKSVEKPAEESSTKRSSNASKVAKNVKAVAHKEEDNTSEKVRKSAASVNDKNIIISDDDIYLFHKGCNSTSYSFMGAHYRYEGRKWGVRFTTWAPKAEAIYLVGEFNDWQVNEDYAMEKITEHGIWTVFIKDVTPGQLYKYAVKVHSGEIVLKSDPYAFQSELRPNTASIVTDPKKYKWADRKWISKRKKTELFSSPVSIYELHLGSWRRNAEGKFLSYRELAEQLIPYLKEMGYTHVEIMPIMEHPLDDSWGYQITNYYAPTSRYGSPEDFKYLVDSLHQEDIGVILDWVPGHFCKDSHGLYMFDGTPTYEYEEQWKADNSGWGAANFDLGRPEVKSFLISNALYWMREFHVDGFRVDAVANMIYLDYGREKGQWTPNKNGGRENLEAIEFLRELNTAIFKEFPNNFMIAEESTAWPMVTRPIEDGGLGFNFKWNMGWMNDMLKYIELDPVYRKFHHNLITFSMMYAYSENFILPLSHDEVVHGKKSLVDKMWGDYWNKFAGLRNFIAYMFAHPGKKTLFMGNDFAQFLEWRFYESLEWDLIDKLEMHKKTQLFFKTINEFYTENKALWEMDYDPEGFQWIDADNANQSIISFMRKTKDPEETLVVVCNFTPVVYYNYNIGVPYPGEYIEVLNTDDEKFGGSGQVMEGSLFSEPVPCHNQEQHIQIKVPPMATTIIKLKNK